MDRDSIEQAIEQLYRLYYQPVLRHLERLVRQHESADDLCQETFRKAFKHWDHLRDTTCVRSWLYRIATNQSLTICAVNTESVLRHCTRKQYVPLLRRYRHNGKMPSQFGRHYGL
jgi:RNA polymerase sigma factor (sigma-70 family)